MVIIKFSKNRKIKLNFIKRYSRIMKKMKGDKYGRKARNWKSKWTK